MPPTRVKEENRSWGNWEGDRGNFRNASNTSNAGAEWDESWLHNSMYGNGGYDTHGEGSDAEFLEEGELDDDGFECERESSELLAVDVSRGFLHMTGNQSR